MNRFSKILLAMFALGCVSLPVLAADSVTAGFRTTASRAQLSSLCTTSPTACLVNSVGIVINVVLSALGIVLLAYVMWGGFTWMTA
ncbi:MAG: hypothetical protein HY984_00495, partial [Candidatus Magasanikbacteria bacterium]|nr:hypothetical protein [Candidatus Magasanikbacteria bacterium]